MLVESVLDWQSVAVSDFGLHCRQKVLNRSGRYRGFNSATAYYVQIRFIGQNRRTVNDLASAARLWAYK